MLPETPCENRYDIDPGGSKKRILTVDGGGMRGAIPIAMLMLLEEKTGKRACELFDMVVGTSTGAIIAVGLAAGYSAREIFEEVYVRGLPAAFRALRPGPLARLAGGLLHRVAPLGEGFWSRLLANGLRHAYPLEPFRRELAPMLERKHLCRVRDLNFPDQPILLVTTKDARTSDTYFIVNAGPGQRHFQDWPLSGVVAASGAAPIFFPPVVSRLVDGGVGVYSNPCLAAAVEALEYIGRTRPGEPGYSRSLEGFADGNVILVSLGTGYQPTDVVPAQAGRYRVWDWLRYVIYESLDEAALQQVYTTRAIYGRRPANGAARIDFRRYNPLLTADSVTRELGIALEGRPDPARLALDSYAEEAVWLMAEIGRRYAERLCWSTPHVMPWDTAGGHHRPSPRAIFERNMENLPVEWQNTPYACSEER